MSEFITAKGDEVIDIIEQLKTYEDEFEICFVTNEDLRFDDVEELLGQISIKEISNAESDVLDRLFGGGFGNANVFSNISDLASEIDEDDEDDEDDEEDFFSFDEQRYEEIKQKDITKVKENLNKYGWSMLAIDDEDYLFKYSNSSGEVGFGDIELGKDLINKLRV